MCWKPGGSQQHRPWSFPREGRVVCGRSWLSEVGKQAASPCLGICSPSGAASQQIWGARGKQPLWRRGLTLCDSPESCSSQNGAGVAQPSPLHPYSQFAAPWGGLSFCFPSCPLAVEVRAPAPPNTFPMTEVLCGWEGRGFSGLSFHPRGGGAAPSCLAVPAGRSSSQSRGVAQIGCGLAAVAGLGFR